MKSHNTPLVSIVTIVYNGEKYIEKCIQSVRDQTYKNIEYIIIDGGSKDATISIINKYKDTVNVIVSEKDNGISDAFNKGIARCTGRIIGMINSDDYFEPDAIEDVVTSYIENGSQSGIYYGNIRYFDDDMSYIRISDITKIWKYMSLNHPTVFVTADIYQQIGVYKEDYRYTMDAEFLHRALHHKIPFFYINKSLANFRLEGASDLNYKKMNKEFYRSVRTYNDQGIVTSFWYYWSVFKKDIARTRIGTFFYKRKHLISFLLSGQIAKG